MLLQRNTVTFSVPEGFYFCKNSPIDVSSKINQKKRGYLSSLNHLKTVEKEEKTLFCDDFTGACGSFLDSG